MQSRRQFTKGMLAAGLAAPVHFCLSETAFAAQTYSFGPNKLDWYPAKSGGVAPILIYAHGGAWALGNRGQVGSKARHFTRNGYHFASVSYTLFPAANVETQALQVGAAVNWVHQNASRLGGDPNRIALMGHSAGCHLSALSTLTGAAPAVRALICNDTRAYDLKTLAKTNGGRLPLLYAAPFSNRKMWSAWSPISYAGLKQQPPTLVAWSGGSGRDKLSINFANALERDGTEVVRYDGKRQYSHISIDRRMGSEKGRLTGAVDNFLADILNRTG